MPHLTGIFVICLTIGHGLGCRDSSVRPPSSATASAKTSAKATSSAHTMSIPTSATATSSMPPAARFVESLVLAAAAGDTKALDLAVDWPFVRRLAKLSKMYEPTVEHLAKILTSARASGSPKSAKPCTIVWTLSDGGLRLDFPPTMIGDAPAAGAENDAVHKELYQGYDVVAVCNRNMGEDVYEDGHHERVIVSEEQFVVQVVAAGKDWRVRGWALLKK